MIQTVVPVFYEGFGNYFWQRVYQTENEGYFDGAAFTGFTGTVAHYRHPWAAKRPGVSIWAERSNDLVNWTRGGLLIDHPYSIGAGKLARGIRFSHPLGFAGIRQAAGGDRGTLSCTEFKLMKKAAGTRSMNHMRTAKIQQLETYGRGER